MQIICSMHAGTCICHCYFLDCFSHLWSVHLGHGAIVWDCLHSSNGSEIEMTMSCQNFCWRRWHGQQLGDWGLSQGEITLAYTSGWRKLMPKRQLKSLNSELRNYFFVISFGVKMGTKTNNKEDIWYKNFITWTQKPYNTTFAKTNSVNNILNLQLTGLHIPGTHKFAENNKRLIPYKKLWMSPGHKTIIFVISSQVEGWEIGDCH